FTGDDEAGGLIDRFEESDGEFSGLLSRLLRRFGFPIGDAGAEDLVNGDLRWDLEFYFARETLGDFKSDFGGEGCRVFGEAEELSEVGAETQREFGAVVFGLAFPRKGE